MGRGLEGVMTDLMSMRVIDENFSPAFRENKYAEGLAGGIERISPLLRGEVMAFPEKKEFNPEEIQGILIFVAMLGW